MFYITILFWDNKKGVAQPVNSGWQIHLTAFCNTGKDFIIIITVITMKTKHIGPKTVQNSSGL